MKTIRKVYRPSLTVRFWHTDELHVAKLLAVKRAVVIGRNWPTAAIHGGQYYSYSV